MRWHWVSESGTQQELSEEQLIAGLSSESIPVFALVWREGWGEWLPAMQVVELAWALPAGRADTPRKPSRGGAQSPAPDISAYPALRERAHRIRTGELKPIPQAADRPQAPRVPPSATRLEPPKLKLPSLPQPPVPRSTRGGTGSVGPAWPPRRTDDATVVARPVGDEGPRRSLDAPGGQLPPSDTQHSVPDGMMAALGTRGSPQQMLLMLGLLFLAAVAVVAVALPWLQDSPVVVGSDTPNDSVTPAAAVPGSDEAQSNPGGTSASGFPVPQCKIRRGRQVAEWVLPQVRPTFATLPDGKVALGYAQTAFYAFGVVVDLKTLNFTPSFREYRKQSIFSVVPSPDKDGPVFAVQRQPADLLFATALPGAPKLVVGQLRNTLALSSNGGAPKRLWSIPTGRTISVPVVASLDNGDFAMTLRLDGDSGDVLVGMLDAKGKNKGTLTKVESGATQFGDPSLAVRGRTTLLIFAGRKANEANWNIFAAKGKDGALPTQAKPLTLGTPKSTATFITPLGDHHFMLLYSERSALESVTKAVVLDEELRILGSPLEVSTETQQSTSAGLWAIGKDALALYFVTSGTNTEMWGASLRCTP